MSAARLSPTGYHFEQHGAAVPLVARSPSLSAVAQCAYVYSHRLTKVCAGQAVVLLEVSNDPFRLHAHLSPEGARALAANLLQAAYLAELAQAAVDARAAKPQAVTP